jgi:SAM-dependent methyltransferase
MQYKRVSDAAHVVATENALRHWDARRPSTSHASIEPHNIGQMSSRVDALLRSVAWMEAHGLDITTDHVLDVGAAQGYGLWQFLLSGFPISSLHGIDLFEDRVAEGCNRTPGLDLRVGDATAMPYADGEFALVCEQFCFCHIPDDEAKRKIAAEMMRVSNKFILIHDWRLGSRSRKLYAVSQAKISHWFPGYRVMLRTRSQLWPPIGRPLSLYAPLLYDAFRIINPFVGSWMTVLQKQ